MIEVLNFLVSAKEVVIGSFQAGFAFAAGSFRLFAGRRVDHNALHLRRRAVARANADQVAQPNHAAIGGEHPIFETAVLSLGGKLSAQGNGPLTVFGMNMGLPEIRLVEPAPDGIAKQTLGLLANKREPQAEKLRLPNDAVHRV